MSTAFVIALSMALKGAILVSVGAYRNKKKGAAGATR